MTTTVLETPTGTSTILVTPEKKRVTLSKDAVAALKRFNAAKEAIKAAEEIKKEAEAILRAEMGTVPGTVGLVRSVEAVKVCAGTTTGIDAKALLQGWPEAHAATYWTKPYTFLK